ncbi:MAG: thioredoxin domain-containing protein [Acidilobaceae archaeon]
MGRGKGKKSRESNSYKLLVFLVVLAFIVSSIFIVFNVLGRRGVEYPDFSGFHVYFDSNTSLFKGFKVPVVGSSKARYDVYIFHDLYCSFCAREMVESLGLIVNSVSDGKIRVAFIDFTVHASQYPEVIRSHALLRSTIDTDSLFLSLMYKAYYRLYSENKFPDPGFLSSLLNQSNLRVNESIVNEESSIVSALYRVSLSLGVRGTPTIIIYDREFNTILNVIEGYQGKDLIERILRGLP